MQRRTAAVLRPLDEEGYLALHDVALPGWLDSLEHLVVGPTGVWVVASWQHRRLALGGIAPPIGTVRGLRGQADAVTRGTGGWAQVPVRPLLCVHSRFWLRFQSSDGLRVAASPQLPVVLSSGPRTASDELGRATDRLLDVLRPAA